MSIAFIISYSILLYSFFTSDMMLKTNPKILDQIVATDKEVLNINLNNKNFGFLIQIFSSDLTNPIKYIDPTVLNINAKLIFYGNFTPITEKNLKLFNCT